MKSAAFSLMFLIQNLPVNTVCPRISIRILIVFYWNVVNDVKEGFLKYCNEHAVYFAVSLIEIRYDSS